MSTPMADILSGGSATLWTLHKGGPKPAIIVAAVLVLVGNWIRYGGTRANNFGTVMFGQILVGLAQPFVLSAPTRYRYAGPWVC
jgi:MFS transporter, FLVCR family, MFS-domain-containing protein 7